MGNLSNTYFSVLRTLVEDTASHGISMRFNYNYTYISQCVWSAGYINTMRVTLVVVIVWGHGYIMVNKCYMYLAHSYSCS